MNQPTTLLTNLQRGNTQTQTPVVEKEEVSLHERAGQGEIAEGELSEGKMPVNHPFIFLTQINFTLLWFFQLYFDDHTKGVQLISKEMSKTVNIYFITQTQTPTSNT